MELWQGNHAFSGINRDACKGPKECHFYSQGEADVSWDCSWHVVRYNHAILWAYQAKPVSNLMRINDFDIDCLFGF